MEEFTKLMVASIADSLVKPTLDQFGNQMQSPLQNFLYRWSEEHKAEIQESIGKKVNIDEVSRKIADDVVKQIERFGGSMSYDVEKFKGKLDSLVMEKLAERIASRIELPIK